MSNPRDFEIGTADQSPAHSLSRRDVLRNGAAAVVGGAAILGGAPALAQGQAPAVVTSGRSMAGTRFRALIRRPGQNTTVESVILRAIQPHEVVIRTQAAQACYTITNALIIPPPPGAGRGAAPGAAGAAGAAAGGRGAAPGAAAAPAGRGAAPAAPPAPPAAVIQGHGAVGIVLEVGSSVRRVQVGDRVVVPVTAQCGQCWLCLHGRGDACAVGAGRPVFPVADTTDGLPVNGTLGGFAEMMVAWEEQTVPIVSNVPAAELSLLSCVMSCGLGLAMRRMPVEAGTDVLVLGAGPLGLSAVQGARIQGAAQIIVVEPVRYRRELAIKVGATTVIDPNVDRGVNNADLITKIRTLCKNGVERSYGGGRGPNLAAYGPMYTLEAVGGDRFPPKVEAGPDPTGVESLQLAWNICPSGGVIRTCGVGQGAGTTVTFPAGQWANALKTHIPGNFAGVNTMRDIPEFVRLIEAGRFDAKALVGQTFPLEKAREALQTAADRTAISAVVSFA
jgi:S-(hydroxymethyl)glutathione dehydrogenase/alcohol dehydrogenase